MRIPFAIPFTFQGESGGGEPPEPVITPWLFTRLRRLFGAAA